ncbi:HigA family addiction module antidote protein [Geomonas sp. Red875]|uniref:HigA family addiction module antidote protein n=2 Tax=Geomesophilobacter sediminis TaxID=2798584 RepID=A0A8J7LZ50_9BACT|nr:HigA family addiction module antidote protein [Geomesophilobacter sediminis]
MNEQGHAPVHPGKVLLAKFLEPKGISQYRLAKEIGVTPRRVNEIVRGRRTITADTALRLGRFFEIEPQFWLSLQAHYDMARAEDVLQGRLEQEIRTISMLVGQ